MSTLPRERPAPPDLPPHPDLDKPSDEDEVLPSGLFDSLNSELDDGPSARPEAPPNRRRPGQGVQQIEETNHVGESPPAPMASMTPPREPPKPLLVAPSLPRPEPRDSTPIRPPSVPQPLLDDPSHLPPGFDEVTPISPETRAYTARTQRRNALKRRVRLMAVAVLTALVVLLAGFSIIRLVNAYQNQLARQAAELALAPQPVQTPEPVEMTPEPEPVTEEPIDPAAEATPEPEPEPSPSRLPPEPVTAPDSVPVSSAAPSEGRPLTIAERSRMSQQARETGPVESYDPARPPAALRNDQLDPRPEVEPTSSRRPTSSTPSPRSTSEDDLPPPVNQKMVSVSFASGPDDIWLERDGRQFRGSEVPEGSYDIKAVWDGAEVLAGRADLQGASSVTVRCSTGFQRCRIAP